jgi:hypothetical protein
MLTTPITRGRWGELEISTGGIEDGDTRIHPLRSSFLFYELEKAVGKRWDEKDRTKKTDEKGGTNPPFSLFTVEQ